MTDSRNASDSTDPVGGKEAIDAIRQVSTNMTGQPLIAETAVLPGEGSPAPLHVGRRILSEEANIEMTAFHWSTKKKWTLLTVVALCQTSMNFNAAIYSNAIEGINEHFGITHARMGMVAFLVTYAFGCELWAPWSEEIGRWMIMQLSLGSVNISILVCALAPTFETILAGRVFGGLSSAGGSVTLGMVADMFQPEEQQYAVLWASLWSCLGAVVGGICGGPIQQYLPWRWNFWIQLCFSVFTQLLHGLVAKETRATCMLDAEAKKMRKRGEDVVGPNEARHKSERFAAKKILSTMWRPYHMLLTEPIILLLSLLSGFADALIFSFFESYGYVFALWNFTPVQTSLALLPLAGSYWLAYFSFFPVVRRHEVRRKNGEVLKPELRLWWLLFQVILLPVGLLGSAFVAKKTLGPAGMIAFSVLIGMANYSIYYATIDYMVAAYGEFSASATGGNGFCRDFLAGICSFYTGPMYHNIGIQNSLLVLFAVGFAFCIPVYVFYWKGETIRRRSRFAMELADIHERAVAMRGHLQQHTRPNVVDEEKPRGRTAQDESGLMVG